MSNTIRNYSTTCLAPTAIRKAWREYKWNPISVTPNMELDVSRYKNLLIRCHSCDAELCDGDSASGARLCSCPDCGGKEFDVVKLAECQEIDVPSFRIRLSNKSFLRMELPQDLKREFSIHYTLDGSAPTRSSQRFTRPFSLPSNVIQVKVRLYGADMVSRVYSLDMPHGGICPLCRYEIKSNGMKCTCTGCGSELQWDEKKQAWVPDPTKTPSFKCGDCGATVLATGDVCRCPVCDAIHHKKGGRWCPGENTRVETLREWGSSGMESNRDGGFEVVQTDDRLALKQAWMNYVERIRSVVDTKINETRKQIIDYIKKNPVKSILYSGDDLETKYTKNIKDIIDRLEASARDERLNYVKNFPSLSYVIVKGFSGLESGFSALRKQTLVFHLKDNVSASLSSMEKELPRKTKIKFDLDNMEGPPATYVASMLGSVVPGAGTIAGAGIGVLIDAFRCMKFSDEDVDPGKRKRMLENIRGELIKYVEKVSAEHGQKILSIYSNFF